MTDGILENSPISKIFFLLDQNCIEAFYSRNPGILPVQEDHQSRFYAEYRKVAEEYDKEFLKKYDEDLNTTLIFVSFTLGMGERALTWISGRSVLRCNFRLHH